MSEEESERSDFQFGNKHEDYGDGDIIEADSEPGAESEGDDDDDVAIEEEDDEDDPSAESRTTPTGVGSETEDYYDTDYEVYTGRNAASACGSYKRLDGSTQKTRQRAYNDFLANLSRNGLLGDEDTTDFTKVDYYFVELARDM